MGGQDKTRCKNEILTLTESYHVMLWHVISCPVILCYTNVQNGMIVEWNDYLVDYSRRVSKMSQT